MEGTQLQMLPIGTLLKSGEYRVERYISSGGFGNTYEVVHTRLPKRFAVKEFFMRGINVRQGLDVTVSVTDNRTTFQQMKDKFYKEAQRLAKLEEQHIVEVTDFFEENQTAYYVMKLIDGESLSAMMKRTGKPFSEAEVRNILTQVLQALETVHAQGIYHLDLKPGNIMRDKKNCCWIIDFGASKQLSATETQTMSTSTGLCYTPGYAPGEQISGNMNRIGPWTDFYALGATLYNLLTRQSPPEIDDVRYDGEHAFRFPSDVSGDMRQLVVWLMQSDYRQRPQRVAEITSRLNEMPQPKQPEVKETDTQPEVTVTLHPSIFSKTPQSENTVQNDSYIYDDQSLFPWKNADGKWGYIDKTGKVVIPCKWKYAYSFYEGLAQVKNDDDKYGFIDKTGKLVSPCKWKSAESFDEGLARVENDEGKYGFIDKTGKLVIPCKWEKAWAFSEGLARVKDDDGKYGYIDKMGQEVIPCKWKSAARFSEGLARVKDDDGKWGFINKAGKVVIPCKWRRRGEDFREGLARVRNYRNKWGFINKLGEEVIPCKWKDADDFREGLARVKDDDWKWGYIDKTGKLVSPCKWKDAGDFREGLARVKDKDGNEFFIDKTGQVVSPCEKNPKTPTKLGQTTRTKTPTKPTPRPRKPWSWLLACASVIALFAVLMLIKNGGHDDTLKLEHSDVGSALEDYEDWENDEDWEIDEEEVGEVEDVIEAEGSNDNVGPHLYPWKDSDGRWGYTNMMGQVVIPCKWNSARIFSEGLAAIEDDKDKWGFIDKTGIVVIPCKWKYAYNFSEGMAQVKDEDGNILFIDKTGKVVKPF